MDELGNYGAFWNAILQSTWFIVFLYIYYREKNPRLKRGVYKRSGKYSHKAIVKKEFTYYYPGTENEEKCCLVDFEGGRNGKNIIMSSADFETFYKRDEG